MKDPLGKGLETHLLVLKWNIWEMQSQRAPIGHSMISETARNEVRILSP